MISLRILANRSLALLSSFIFISNLYGAPPKLISPPFSLDEVFNNLPLVMDNWFQPPWYQGSPAFPPNRGIIGQFNSFLGRNLTINPCNDKIVLMDFRLNRFRDRSGTYRRFNGYQLYGKSVDGGFTFSYFPPPEPLIPLGGTISQNINLTQLRYNKKGELFSLNLFRNLIAIPPNINPTSGLYIERSNNNGKTWTKPKILVEFNASDIFSTGPFSIGVGIEGAAMLPDPVDPDLIHVAYPSLVLPTTFYGNLFYLRSTDGGETFTRPKQIYSMMSDPLWLEKHFDPNFTSDPLYFTYGGQSWTAGGRFVPVDEDVLLLSFFRLYPRVGSTIYNQQQPNTISDKAVLRSLDNGKTWQPIASATEQYVFPFVHDPALEFGEFDVSVPDGTETNLCVYSPQTGRVYMAYMANNPAVSPDPVVNQFYPRLLLVMSNDKGASWSDPVQINVTPRDIPFGQQQAFQPSMVLTNDGKLVVGYYDFRNYTGGTDITSVLQTDAWLAIYQETPNAKGGSTGVGLDFIEEKRLTPTSFNARVTKNSNYQSYAGNNSLNMAVNNKNELLVTFLMANTASPNNITIGYKNMTIDTNNRLNVFIKHYQFPHPTNR